MAEEKAKLEAQKEKKEQASPIKQNPVILGVELNDERKDKLTNGEHICVNDMTLESTGKEIFRIYFP